MNANRTRNELKKLAVITESSAYQAAMSTRKYKRKENLLHRQKRTEREDFKDFNESDLPTAGGFVNWVSDGIGSGVRKQLFQHVAPAGSRSCASTTQRTLPALSVEIK